jgi:hypothetical protein
VNIILKISISGLLFLFSIVTGLLLHKSGRPLNTSIFTIHKLTAVGLVIFMVLLIYNFLKDTNIEITTLLLIIVAGLSFLALFVSGALLSIEKTTNKKKLLTHNIATLLALFSTTAVVFLLMR